MTRFVSVPQRRRSARWRCRFAAVAAASVCLPHPAPALEEIPIGALAAGASADVPAMVSDRGLEVPVDLASRLLLPLQGAQELEIEAVAQGLLTLTWASESGGRVAFRGPPWRYRRLPAGAVGLHLDMRQTAGWTPSSRPALLLAGTGHLTLTRLRAGFAPADPEATRAGLDRAVRWAPESVGHTTINTLTPPFWSASRRIHLAQGLAWVFGALLAVGIALALWRRRPGGKETAVAAACLAAVALWDAGFLVRFLPAANLSIRLDPEDRIRENYSFAPEVGALAALARTALGPGERIGVLARRGDWFSPQTLCFNLAPRRCVFIEPGAGELAGISGVIRLRADEIDAVVALHPDRPLPDGFVPVAGVSPRAFIARRP